MISGVDVSSWQPNVNWKQLYAQGVRFAYLKVSEGLTITDKMYATHRRNANKAGIIIGGYHFARPGEGNPITQAKRFLHLTAIRKGDLLPALDLENAGGLSPTALVSWGVQFREEVIRQLRSTPVLYTYKSFWPDHMANTRVFANCPLWIAGSSPWLLPGWTNWTIWQSGSPNNLDRDKANSLPIYRPVTVIKPPKPKPGKVYIVRMSEHMFKLYSVWYARLKAGGKS